MGRGVSIPREQGGSVGERRALWRLRVERKCEVGWAVEGGTERSWPAGWLELGAHSALAAKARTDALFTHTDPLLTCPGARPFGTPPMTSPSPPALPPARPSASHLCPFLAQPPPSHHIPGPPSEGVSGNCWSSLLPCSCSCKSSFPWEPQPERMEVRFEVEEGRGATAPEPQATPDTTAVP